VSMVLEAKGLGKRFGSFHAVAGVDLAVEEGTVHSVIGPNGAGKTTLFRLLTGVLAPSSGTLVFHGERIGGKRPHAIARRGLVQSFQMTSIFPRLTVLESVEAAIVARERRALDCVTRFHRSTAPEALELLDSVGLADVASLRADTLSHGDQRALDIALALATRPSLLLLDEPTAGMSPDETHRIQELVSDLARGRGLTVLFSEHDMDVVFGISDRVTVLLEGRVITEGSVAEVQADPQVMAVYLGSAEVAA
jgi:branched-chain amino acid transport system ATP-binding protein